jgi:hypothetical protein
VGGGIRYDAGVYVYMCIYIYIFKVLLTPEGNVAGQPGQWEPAFYTDRALAWLRSSAAAKPPPEEAGGLRRPFLLTVSWRPPHGPWGLESKASLDAVMGR